MAYPNHKNYNSYGGGRNYQEPQKREVPPFPVDYVDFAEKLMERKSRDITTSKLRNILSLLMDVYNTEMLRTDGTVCQDSVVKLQMARIRMAYECGRDPKTKYFINDANLIDWLKGAGDSREKVLHYIHYVEALVAYHRFFGGREN